MIKDIIMKFQEFNSIIIKSNNNVSPNIRANKETIDDFEYINNELIFSKNKSISEFYRSLFISYFIKPRYIGEQIIFKNNYNLINKAINYNKNIYLKLNNNHYFDDIISYKLVYLKEESFNYLLYKKDKNYYNFRLSRIKSIRILNSLKILNDEDLNKLKRMEKYPQFFF